MSKGNTSITIEEFADKIHLTTHFKNRFLYPFYAGSWGADVADAKAFAAYDVLTWSNKHKPAGMFADEWLEVVGVLQSTYKH